MPKYKVYISEIHWGEAYVEADSSEEAYDKVCEDWDLVEWVDGQVEDIHVEEVTDADL